MNRNIPAIFAISALILLILCSACTSLPSDKEKEGGLQQVAIPAETPRISFEEAKLSLGEYRKTSLNESSIVSEKIYYVSANDVDEYGNATSWVFGVKTAKTELLVYKGKVWTDIPWIIPELPSEIYSDRVISPKNLFAQNKAAIFGDSSKATTERRDIELKDGVYTVSITTGNSVRILNFNASTGAAIA